MRRPQRIVTVHIDARHFEHGGKSEPSLDRVDPTNQNELVSVSPGSTPTDFPNTRVEGAFSTNSGVERTPLYPVHDPGRPDQDRPARRSHSTGHQSCPSTSTESAGTSTSSHLIQFLDSKSGGHEFRKEPGRGVNFLAQHKSTFGSFALMSVFRYHVCCSAAWSCMAKIDAFFNLMFEQSARILLFRREPAYFSLRRRTAAGGFFRR